MPSAVLAARSDWREMSVGHYELFSTLSDSATRKVALQMLGFEQTVGGMLQTGDRLPDTPTRIYLLTDHDFNEFAAPHPGLGGFFVPLRFGNVMVVDADKDFAYVKVALFHEAIHFIQRNTSSEQYPPWYMEGFAELFSGFKLSDDDLSVGYLPDGVGIRRDHWIPIERLLAVQQSDPEYQKESLMPQFYGEAWALVHLLLFDDTTLSGPTQRYLQLMNDKIPEPEAFASAFPFDKATLDLRLQKFVRDARIRILKYRLKNPVDVDQAPMVRLTVAQADAEMTRLIWQLRRPKALVDELLAESLAEQPDDLPVQALAARIHAQRGDAVSVDGLAAPLAGGVNDLPARIDLAAALLSSKNGPASGKALAVLGDLPKLANPPVEAVELWGFAAARAGVNPGQIAAQFEPLRSRVPQDTTVLATLAAAYERMGDKAKSRDSYNQIILVSHSSEERTWAQKQADSARLDDATPLKGPPEDR